MHIATRRTGNRLLVRLIGELDLEMAAAFTAAVQHELASSHRIQHLVLDLRGVTFIDSAGVGALIGRYKDIRRRGNGQVVAFGSRPQVRRILEFTGLLRLMAVADSQKQALAALREGDSAS